MRITAVDQDPVVVARAAAECRSWPEIRVVRANATRLRFADRSFDFVTSMLLHYFGLAEAAGVLAAWRRRPPGPSSWPTCGGTGFSAQPPPCWAASRAIRSSARRTVTRSDVVLGRLGGQAGFARMRVRRHAPFRRSLVGLL
jgi:SAM-dependent methyltransferase